MDGESGEKRTFVFFDFELVDGQMLVRKDGGEIHLAKRPRDILRFLIENRDRVVSRGELLDRFWEGRDVYDDALRKAVSSIRKAVNDIEKPSCVLETRYGEGFRFIADVSEIKHNGSGNGNGKALSEPTKNGFHVNTSLKASNGHYLSSQQPVRRLSRNMLMAAVAGLLIFASLGFYVYSTNSRNGPAFQADAGNVTVRSIAILPLKNLTGDAANDYFSDGITESIITQLARIDEIKVISRSSTFSFKDKDIGPIEIGRQLSVDALLEGSVRKRGDWANISVRLIDARDGSVIWTGEDFERPITNAYDLQNAIACKVAAELRTELCGKDGTGSTNDGLAYQEYLKGRYEWNKRTSAGIKASIDHYNKAIAIDPAYSLAYSGLSESYVQGIWHVPFNANEVLPKARESGLRAVELDQNSAEARTALASVYSLEWNWAESERELQTAIAINPKFARVHHVQAFGLMLVGRFDESIRAINKAEELDPLNLVISTDKAQLLFAAGRNDEALRQWDKTFSLDPNFVMAREHRAVAFEVLGMESNAIEAVSKIMELKGRNAESIAAFRQTALNFGLKEVRRRELKNMQKKVSRGEQVSPVILAIYYVLLGQRENAFDSLERAGREHDTLIVLIRSPQFAAISSDPRFIGILQRTGMAG